MKSLTETIQCALTGSKTNRNQQKKKKKLNEAFRFPLSALFNKLYETIIFLPI